MYCTVLKVHWTSVYVKVERTPARDLLSCRVLKAMQCNEMHDNHHTSTKATNTLTFLQKTKTNGSLTTCLDAIIATSPQRKAKRKYMEQLN